jgi:hypothetical protein
VAPSPTRDYWGSWSLAVSGAALALGLYVVAAFTVTAVVSVALRRKPPVEATITLIIAVGLLAALPVSFSYSDGCNKHDTTSPVGLVPVLALVRPDYATLSYEQAETMMICGTAVPITAGS